MKVEIDFYVRMKDKNSANERRVFLRKGVFDWAEYMYMVVKRDPKLLDANVKLLREETQTS